jgi:hypothetical protein
MRMISFSDTRIGVQVVLEGPCLNAALEPGKIYSYSEGDKVWPKMVAIAKQHLPELAKKYSLVGADLKLTQPRTMQMQLSWKLNEETQKV